MGTNIILKEELASNAVHKAARDYYKVKMERESLQHLYDMLHTCVLLANNTGGFDLDILVMEELREDIERKYYNVEHKASFKLKPSQAHVVFLWLNNTEFAPGTYDMLARKLVDQLYRQIV